MSTFEDPVAPAMARNKRLLPGLIVVSAILHYLIINSQQATDKPTQHTPYYQLDITLAPANPGPKSGQPVPRPQTSQSSPQHAAAGVAQTPGPATQQQVAKAAAQALQLDNTAIENAINSVNQAKHRPGLTDTGAVVMNGDLLTLLNQSTQKIARLDSTDARTSYSGNGWSEHIQLGDRCFRVEAANPLDEASVEKWFKVDCR